MVADCYKHGATRIFRQVILQMISPPDLERNKPSNDPIKKLEEFRKQLAFLDWCDAMARIYDLITAEKY